MEGSYKVFSSPDRQIRHISFLAAEGRSFLSSFCIEFEGFSGNGGKTKVFCMLEGYWVGVRLARQTWLTLKEKVPRRMMSFSFSWSF